jgi:sugar (pentulose or hexulose) kinase
VPSPLARGALVGLTLRHDRSHAARAVLEGTVFQIRRVVDAVAARSGHAPLSGVVCGGATRSALWMQVLADVTGMTLRIPAVVESGALGAAIIGGAAAGLFTAEDGQRRLVRHGARFAPDAERAARYATLYARYCSLDDLLLPWFNANPNDAENAEKDHYR